MHDSIGRGRNMLNDVLIAMVKARAIDPTKRTHNVTYVVDGTIAVLVIKVASVVGYSV